MAQQAAGSLNQSKAKLGQNFDDAKDRANTTINEAKQTIDNATQRVNETVNEVKETASGGFTQLKDSFAPPSKDQGNMSKSA